jgi:quinoprotein glucose dehydrogenase
LVTRRARNAEPPRTIVFRALALALAAIAPLLPAARAAQGAAPRSVWTGVYTGEQAMRGGPLYGASCGSCHGPALEGGEMAPALSGGPFNANWNGLTLGDLFERIRISMPQNSPGSLSRQAYVDILAFMLRSGSFPEGPSELPRETELLKQITFESTRP